MATTQDVVNWLNNNYDWLISFIIILSFTIYTMIYFNRKDQLEKEPLYMILIAFMLGIISVVPSVIMSLLLASVIPYDTAIFVAPFTEEIGKGVFLLLIASSKEFDGPLDGLVYGAMIGAGFAFAENLLYAYDILLSYGVLASIINASFRSVLQIIGHPLFTGVFGVGIGFYKIGKAKWRISRIWYAILLHGVWNASASIPGIGGLVALFIVALIYAFVILRREIRITTKIDQKMANG